MSSPLRGGAVMREGETVMPLELFFDLVFVLAITQTTVVMEHGESWTGMVQGLAVLAVMWWAWTAYAWLTSVVDPEEGWVRIAIATAMVGLLVCTICMPEVFGDRGTMFAAAYGVVRAMHIVLFVIASEDAPELRRSTIGLAVSTTIAVGFLFAAAQVDGALQACFWAGAIAVDFGGALVTDVGGWRLRPRHFAERHGGVIIIALGESVVAVGAGAAGDELTATVLVTAVLGAVIAFVVWWLYFDVVSIASTKRLAAAEPGRVQNSMARDSYSYLHLPMVAGIVLVAFGLSDALHAVGEPLALMPLAALCGGFALYLLGHVAFRCRHIRTLNRQRTAIALALLVAVPVLDAAGPAAQWTVALVALVGVALVAYEYHLHDSGRRRYLRAVATGRETVG